MMNLRGRRLGTEGNRPLIAQGESAVPRATALTFQRNFERVPATGDRGDGLDVTVCFRLVVDLGRLVVGFRVPLIQSHCHHGR
jgi:hypothetical protein